MSLSRRDFMKLVGVSVASLLLTRCQIFQPTVSCYVTVEINDNLVSPRDRLRKYWLSFGELAQRTREASEQGDSGKAYKIELISEHLYALNDLVAGGELSTPVADLVQEAYTAAAYHVWRSNILETCYAPVIVDYAPISANILIEQAVTLDEIAAQGTVDPATLETARTALEHDLAFYSLTDEEVSTLYEQIVAEWQAQGKPVPGFEELDLEITPDAQAAAKFIISLFTEE